MFPLNGKVQKYGLYDKSCMYLLYKKTAPSIFVPVISIDEEVTPEISPG